MSRNSLTMRAASRGPTPSARARAALSCAKIARVSASGGTRRQDRQRQPRADPLHRRQQAEPVALGGVDKAVEVDVVLADMRLDQQPRRAAGRRQPADRPGRAEGEIADPADIDDRAVRSDLLEDAGELGDHRAGPRRKSRSRPAVRRDARGRSPPPAHRRHRARRSRSPAAAGAPSICTCAFSA